jgi:hypothetical protein
MKSVRYINVPHKNVPDIDVLYIHVPKVLRSVGFAVRGYDMSWFRMRGDGVAT